MLDRVVTTYLSPLEGRHYPDAKEEEWQILHFNALLYPFSKSSLGSSKPQTFTGIDILAFVDTAEQGCILPLC